MSTKFEAFDRELIAAIAAKPRAFHELTVVMDASAKAIDANQAWRVVDRRLQALRRQGRIEFIGRSHWRVVQATRSAT